MYFNFFLTFLAAGKFVKQSLDFWLYKSTHKNIILCDSNIYSEDKKLIGKVDEVLGPLNEVVKIIII